MFPEYIYKSFDIFTKIKAATFLKLYQIGWRNWSMKVKVRVINFYFQNEEKKYFFTNLNTFLWSVAEDG